MSACAYAQSDQSLCLSLEYSMIVKLLTEHHFEFPRLKGGCTGSSESTLVKIPHCWKSRVTAQMLLFNYFYLFIFKQSLLLSITSTLVKEIVVALLLLRIHSKKTSTFKRVSIL